jgi:hypothetical protein
MDPNALYEIHIDNNGDAAEDITFQFRFNNKLNNIALSIGNGAAQKSVAIALIQAGAVANVGDANLNVNETYTGERGAGRPAQGRRPLRSPRPGRRDLREARRLHRREDAGRQRGLRGVCGQAHP